MQAQLWSGAMTALGFPAEGSLRECPFEFPGCDARKPYLHLVEPAP